MEGLEPIVDWLNQQPSLDWKDYVHSEVSNVPQIHPLMDAVDPGPDDHRLDWLWDSNLDIAQQPQVTVDESEWQREVQALKEENARYGLTVRLTSRVQGRLTVTGFVRGSTVSTLD